MRNIRNRWEVTKKMVVAIIPARGGSKGIPKKNIVDFLGEPLITHTIEQALNSSKIDRLYVSTDADDIARISREAGARVIERPEELATDRATTESALLHAIDFLEDKNIEPEITILLQCTSPLRRKNDIDAAISLVEDGGFDSALSVCQDHNFYWTDEESAEPVNYDPQNRKMRQEIQDKYRENGSIYVFRTKVLKENECRLGGKIGLHEMPKRHSFEIDTPEDLKIVEAIAEKIVSN